MEKLKSVSRWLLAAVMRSKRALHREALKYEYHYSYDLIDDYIFPDDIDEWLECPVCKSKPKIWTFNNGRRTGCKCHNSKYDHFSICAESIMSHIKRHNGSAIKYDCDALKKNWNKWVKTGKIVFKHAGQRKDNRW